MQCLSSQSGARTDAVCEEKETASRTLVSNMVELSWYEVDKVLGRGMQGDVLQYRLRSPRPRAPAFIAVKSVALARDSEKAFEKAEREIRILQRISSKRCPNILRFFGFELSHSFMFLTMELCECDLQVHVKRSCEQPLPPTQLKDYVWQISNGLSFLHVHRVSHRDIKPQNILVSAKGVLKLTDFGLSTVLSTVEPGTLTMTAGGTLPYLAPEIASVFPQNYRGNAMAADIFSAGVVFFELAFTKKPYTVAELSGPALELPGYVKEGMHVEDSIESLLSKMLLWNRSQRMDAHQILNHDYLKGIKPLEGPHRNRCSDRPARGSRPVRPQGAVGGETRGTPPRQTAARSCEVSVPDNDEVPSSAWCFCKPVPGYNSARYLFLLALSSLAVPFLIIDPFCVIHNDTCPT